MFNIPDVDILKLSSDAAFRMIRRALAMRGVCVSPEQMADAVEEAASLVVIRALERPDYDTAKGSVSTWINSIAWFICSNYVRDELIPNLSTVRNEQADRDGTGSGQAFDRLLADHAGQSVQDTDMLSGMEQSGLIRTAVRSKLGRRGLLVLRDWTKGIPAQDTAKKLGVSNATVSVTRNAIRDAVRELV